MKSSGTPKRPANPVSVFLRTLGLAYEPKSVLDAERVNC
jgi:hypothetical protein